MVAGNLRFRMVSAGGADDRGHSCGVTFDERGVCWGYGGAGEPGDGTTYWRRSPRVVAGGPPLPRGDRGHRSRRRLRLELRRDHGRPGLLLGAERLGSVG